MGGTLVTIFSALTVLVFDPHATGWVSKGSGAGLELQTCFKTFDKSGLPGRGLNFNKAHLVFALVFDGHAHGCESFPKAEFPVRLKRNAAGGFTLLELLVVIVVIGLLAGLVAPRYFDTVGKSKIKIARAQIDSLEKALDQYRLDVGRFPNQDQ
eukprot:gene2001-2605_t